jgi:predicted oxidoreductase
VAAELARLAEQHEVTSADVALAFVLAHPARPVPILGTQRPERIRAAAAALEVRLTRQEWYSLYQAGTGEPLP